MVRRPALLSSEGKGAPAGNLLKQECSPPIYGIEADPERTAGAGTVSNIVVPCPIRPDPVLRAPSPRSLPTLLLTRGCAIRRIFRKTRRRLAAPAQQAMICSTGRPPSWGKRRFTCHPSTSLLHCPSQPIGLLAALRVFRLATTPQASRQPLCRGRLLQPNPLPARLPFQTAKGALGHNWCQ